MRKLRSRVGLIALGLTFAVVAPQLVRGQQPYGLVIHPGESRDVEFAGDIVRLEANNWLNDVISVQRMARPQGDAVASYKLGKQSSVRVERDSREPRIVLRFINRNRLDFSILVTEGFHRGSVTQTELPQAELVASLDRDIQAATAHAELPRLIDPHTEYESTLCRYKKYRYFMGRISVKLAVIAHLAQQEAPTTLRVREIERWAATADQRVMRTEWDAPGRSQQVTLDPALRFWRELYRDYTQQTKALHRMGDHIERSLGFIVQNSNRFNSYGERSARKTEILNTGNEAFEKGVYDLGQGSSLQSLVKSVSRRFVEANESPKSSLPLTKEELALELAATVLSIGRVSIHCD